MKTEYCADIIALYGSKLVMIERLSFPTGYALPGGRMEKGESVEDCAKREFKEETGLELKIEGILGKYDAPNRDPRGPKISTAVYGSAEGEMKDEPGKTRVFLMGIDEVDGNSEKFAFDHYQIIRDWMDLGGNLYK
ncbi:MAG: NUDIX hydrolase [Candidatus Woesearchaeota archaeon]